MIKNYAIIFLIIVSIVSGVFTYTLYNKNKDLQNN